MFPYISAAVSLLWVRSFQNLLVLGKRGCVFRFCCPELLSVGGLPAHFVSTQLAGPVAISLPSDQPRPGSRHAADGGAWETRGQTVVVSVKIKAPAWAHQGPPPREPALFTVPHL